MVKISPTQQNISLRFLKRSERIDFVELDDLKKWAGWTTLMRWTFILRVREIPFLSLSTFVKLEKYFCWVNFT